MPSWSVLLVAATALHAGFQLSVTALVYPALVRVPPEQFAQAHVRHSRAITPVVGLVYGGALVVCVGAVAVDPSSVAAWLAAVVTGAAFSVTAVRAAPLHGRLGRTGSDRELLASLVRADRVRTLAAVLALVAALVHAR